MKRSDIDFRPFHRALAQLESALQVPAKNDLERDGVIQRFEYCFELSWKFIRRVLIAMGRLEVSASPRPLLRDARQENFIQNLEIWFEFLDGRNQVAHIYDQKIAEDIYRLAQRFLPYAQQLAEALEKNEQNASP